MNNQISGWKLWAAVIGLLVGAFTLASYGYNVAAFAATTRERVLILERLRLEDIKSIREDLKYIRSRVDDLNDEIRQGRAGGE